MNDKIRLNQIEKRITELCRMRLEDPQTFLRKRPAIMSELDALKQERLEINQRLYKKHESGVIKWPTT